ncbi:hypothetical protein, partial [Promicromonospora kroppenstedtii]|uniref:hypothetical protein n=1 Tax=Promicromonospora kroppenstedtii TaxID=440482 RepID=UPI00056097A2
MRQVGAAWEGYKDDAERDAVFSAVLVYADGKERRFGPWDRKRTAKAVITSHLNGARDRATWGGAYRNEPVSGRVERADKLGVVE